MLANLLTLNFFITSIIRAGEYLHFACFIVYLCDVGIRALLSTCRLALVISVGTVILLMLSVVKAGYRFTGAAAPCSGVQGTYKLHAAAFAQCILLPTLQNVGVKLLATF